MLECSDVCALCSGTALSDSLLKAKVCKFKSDSSQYAALETHLLYPSLPSVPANSFMGSATDRRPCQAGSSIVCTVAAVCHSVRNLEYVAHVAKKGQVDVAELIETTVASSGGRECVVILASAATVEKEAQYSVHSSLVPEGRATTEDTAIKIILSLQSASKGLVWYWSMDLLGYSYILNRGEGGMWALSFGFHESTKEPDSSKVIFPPSRKQNLRVLPFFYCGSEPLSLVIMGTGGVGGFCKDDLTVEAAALSRLPANRAYLSATSTGRCFCCEYMTSLHTEFHSGAQKNTTKTHKLELSKQFWQVTKRH